MFGALGTRCSSPPLLIDPRFFFSPLNLAGGVGGVHEQAARHFSGGARRCRHYLLYALLCVISGYLRTFNQFMVWIVEMSKSLNLQTGTVVTNGQKAMSLSLVLAP